MERNLTWILLNDKSGKGYLPFINQFNIGEGLSGIETVNIGEKTLWPFGDYQTQHDMRMEQMKNGILLKTYKKLSLYDKKHTFTGKRFKIVRISEGKIHGVPPKFSKYIALLERVY